LLVYISTWFIAFIQKKVEAKFYVNYFSSISNKLLLILHFIQTHVYIFNKVKLFNHNFSGVKLIALKKLKNLDFLQILKS
jgi:hypothetical protein